MKKVVYLLVALVFSITISTAQNLADGIKYVKYQKLKSAIETFEQLYKANNKDVQMLYWYGQALLANKDVIGAKSIYQKALQLGLNEPIIWVGMGHVELMETGDINAAKQKFEQAITATTATKGKNKGKPDVAILNAIGRANADGSSKQGDPNWAIEKLKQAGDIDPTNSEAFVSMGICYQKLGGDMGGDAVKSYLEAVARDPKNAEAFWRMGKIYASQGNKEMLDKNFNAAIAANPEFPSTYYDFYKYYHDKDVEKAKIYLDKYIQYADKDCSTDFFRTNYLFLTGNYNEALQKAKEMEAGDCKYYDGLPIMYAFIYDRLGDSVLAKENIEKFFATASNDNIEPAHYDLAIKILSKFSGTETKLISYLQKAIDNDTSKVNKAKYAKQGAEILGKAKMYAQQIIWLQKYNEYKGSMAEVDYYNLCTAYYNAKDYANTMASAQKYITAYPDKPFGYSFNVKAAKALDTTSNPGIAVDALLQYNTFLEKELEKNKKIIINNFYYIMLYYADKVKDYKKALEYCDKILALIPNDPEMMGIRKTLEERASRPAQPNPPKPAPKTTSKPTTGTGTPKPPTKQSTPAKKSK